MRKFLKVSAVAIWSAAILFSGMTAFTSNENGSDESISGQYESDPNATPDTDAPGEDPPSEESTPSELLQPTKQFQRAKQQLQ